MPEPYWPKRKGSYTLADAEKHERFASIRCTYCKRTLYFALGDLRTAFGNIECDDVVYVSRWRCSGCGGKGSLDFKLGDPPGDQSKTAIVRRLRAIDYVRKLVWRDERGV